VARKAAGVVLQLLFELENTGQFDFQQSVERVESWCPGVTALLTKALQAFQQDWHNLD
jgi:hypothetical protein